MIFSPAYLSSLIVGPLRFLCANYAPAELVWTNDPNTTGIEIDTINNFNKIAIQQKPRVLISRGQYSIRPTGLTDNMAQGKGLKELRGAHNRINMFLIDGVAQVMVQARNEGTCEKVTDLIQHFLAWTGPMIADMQGFKTTFMPMNVSPCIPDKEDTELFSCTLNLPYTKEEHFIVASAEEIKIKNFLLALTAEDSQ